MKAMFRLLRNARLGRCWSFVLDLQKRDGEYYGCTSGRSRVDTVEQAL